MYVYPEDVRAVLSGGGTASGAGDVATDDIVASIEQAQTEVDAMLSGRYSVPFPDDQVPSVVAAITRDFAAALVDLFNRGQIGYQSALDPILVRRQRAETLLAAIAGGKANIGMPDAVTGVDSGASHSGRAGVPRNPYPGAMFGPNVTPGVWGNVGDPDSGPWWG